MVKYEKLNDYIYINDNDLCIEITTQRDFFEYMETWIDERENVSRETLKKQFEFINIIDKYNNFIKNNVLNIAVIVYERDENGMIDIINKMFLINPSNMECFGVDLKQCELLF